MLSVGNLLSTQLFRLGIEKCGCAHRASNGAAGLRRRSIGMGTGTRPRVYARLRPMFGRDSGKAVLFEPTENSLSYRKVEGGELSKYTFDRVFDMDAQQEDMYVTIGDVALTSLRKGFNSTVLAYGQTGSGKTYSMDGAKDDRGQYTSRGLIPRVFENVFKMFGEDPDVMSFQVSIQYLELYNEQMQDLLGKRKVVDVGCACRLEHACARVARGWQLKRV